MLKAVLGRKIGMTQVFSDQDKVVPVTVIDLAHWHVTGFKTKERDGYDAIQVGHLRKKYAEQAFSADWLHDVKKYFTHSREVRFDSASTEKFEKGQKVDFSLFLKSGELVNVTGTTKGRGFAGVVKRYGFSGGRASHGPRLGRKPGSVGHMRSQGKIIKGKRLPGHMGADTSFVKNLEVIRVEQDGQIALIKGAVPGGTGSLVFMQKA